VSTCLSQTHESTVEIPCTWIHRTRLIGKSAAKWLAELIEAGLIIEVYKEEFVLEK
jgi:hypothetical protein